MLLFNFLKSVIYYLFKSKNTIIIVTILIVTILLIFCDITIKCNPNILNYLSSDSIKNDFFMIELRNVMFLVYISYYLIFLSYFLFNIFIIKPINFIIKSLSMFNFDFFKKISLVFSLILNVNIISYLYLCITWILYLMLKIKGVIYISQKKYNNVVNINKDYDFEIFLNKLKFNKQIIDTKNKNSNKSNILENINNSYLQLKKNINKLNGDEIVYTVNDITYKIKFMYESLKKKIKLVFDFTNLDINLNRMFYVLYKNYYNVKQIKSTISLAFRYRFNRFGDIDYLTYYLTTTNFFFNSFIFFIFLFCVTQFIIVLSRIVLRIYTYNYIINYYTLNKVFSRIFFFTLFIILTPIINIFFLFFVFLFFLILFLNKI